MGFLKSSCEDFEVNDLEKDEMKHYHAHFVYRGDFLHTVQKIFQSIYVKKCFNPKNVATQII